MEEDGAGAGASGSLFSEQPGWTPSSSELKYPCYMSTITLTSCCLL
jgi:hypothetical protein